MSADDLYTGIPEKISGLHIAASTLLSASAA